MSDRVPCRLTLPLRGRVLVAFAIAAHGASLELVLAKEFKLDNPLNAPPSVYWCPNRTPDQQIAVKPEPGCKPLYDEQEEVRFRKQAEQRGKEFQDRELLKVVEIQNAASAFAKQYRDFLTCCATRVASVEEIDDLIDEANYILKSVQQKGIFNSTGFGIGLGSDGLGGGPGESPKLGTFARQWTLSEIIGTVARARDDLSKLQVRLQQLGEAKEKVETLDFESAGRERYRIQQEEEAIGKEFRAKRPPPAAATGMEIQDTTLPTRIGGDIEDTTLNPNFGADIGYTVSPYSNVGESLKPRRGEDVQDTNLPNRFGPSTQDTTLPYSFGFEIDKAQNPEGSSTVPLRGIGPAIGDSSLNDKRK